MNYTLSFAIDLLFDDYKAWYERGMKTGTWSQNNFLFLRSQAGIGKTAAIYALQERVRKAFHNVADVVELYVSSSIDPESLAGTAAPVAVEIEVDGKMETIHVLRMHYREELSDAKRHGPGAIVFLDEIGREAPHMRAFFLKLIHEQKSIAGFDASQMYVVLAGNTSDRDHVVDDFMGEAAQSSRVIPLDIKADPQTFADYMYTKTPSHQEVANFILDHPEYLIGRDQEGDVNAAFRNPRSWDKVAWALHDHGGGAASGGVGEMKSKAAFCLIQGMVGSQAASFFKSYLTKDRPISVKAILEGNCQPDAKGRIQANPSLIRSLQHWLESMPLEDPQVPNLVNFMNAISLDIASSVLRNKDKILAENLQKLMLNNAFAPFYSRVQGGGRRKKRLSA